jgi:hypothetical protein
VSIAIGSEAGLLALATSGMMLHDKSVRDSQCTVENAQKVCSQDGYSANSSLANLGGWNAAAWTVAAVGIGVGVVLLVTHPNKAQPTTALTVGPAPAGTGAGVGVGVRSTF